MSGGERVAVVTGAGRGVGKGVAHALGAAGWTVYLTGRGTGLAESADGVSRAGGRGIAVVCDAGRSLITAEVALEYAVTDVDGRQPASPRPVFAERKA